MAVGNPYCGFCLSFPVGGRAEQTRVEQSRDRTGKMLVKVECGVVASGGTKTEIMKRAR